MRRRRTLLLLTLTTCDSSNDPPHPPAHVCTVVYLRGADKYRKLPVGHYRDKKF